MIRGGFASLSDADRRDHLGLRVFALGQQVASARGFPGTVLPQMEWLSQQTGEAVLMSVLDGDRQLYVHYVAGPQQVGVIGERGRHGPLPCTSMGKVLVAFAPTEQSVRLVRLVDTVELTRIGPNTITDREQFRAEIENVRTRGYAVADEEHETGIRAIGMPILDIGGRLRRDIRCRTSLPLQCRAAHGTPAGHAERGGQHQDPLAQLMTRRQTGCRLVSNWR